jgi:hypothetical protein
MLSLFMQQLSIPNASICSNALIYPNSEYINNVSKYLKQKEMNYLCDVYKIKSRNSMKQARDTCASINEFTNKLMKLYAMNKQPIFSIILTEESFESHQLAKKEEKMFVKWIAGISFGIFALSAYFLHF